MLSRDEIFKPKQTQESCGKHTKFQKAKSPCLRDIQVYGGNKRKSEEMGEEREEG